VTQCLQQHLPNAPLMLCPMPIMDRSSNIRNHLLDVMLFLNASQKPSWLCRGSVLNGLESRQRFDVLDAFGLAKTSVLEGNDSRRTR
jgi:hypothetical protein